MKIFLIQWAWATFVLLILLRNESRTFAENKKNILGAIAFSSFIALFIIAPIAIWLS